MQNARRNLHLREHLIDLFLRTFAFILRVDLYSEVENVYLYNIRDKNSSH